MRIVLYKRRWAIWLTGCFGVIAQYAGVMTFVQAWPDVRPAIVGSLAWLGFGTICLGIAVAIYLPRGIALIIKDRGAIVPYNPKPFQVKLVRVRWVDVLAVELLERYRPRSPNRDAIALGLDSDEPHPFETKRHICPKKPLSRQTPNLPCKQAILLYDPNWVWDAPQIAAIIEREVRRIREKSKPPRKN